MDKLYTNHASKLPSPYLISFIPLGLFFLLIYKYATNVPYMDDMELVDTINILKEEPSRFLEVLFRQQNDHRSAFARLGIIIASLSSEGINFRLAILLGYLNLIFLGWVFFLIHRAQNMSKWSFLPIPFLLFSPLIYQDHLWTITAYQHTLSIAFSLLSLYYLRPEKEKVWYLSIFCSIAASLSNLDGITAPVIAIFWLIIQSRWRHTGYYFIFTILYYLIYFHDFKLSSASNIPLSFHSILPWFESFLALVGSVAKIFSDSYAIRLSLLFGFFILIVFIGAKLYSLFSTPKYPSHTLFLNYTEICFIRILSSMAFISLGRFASGVSSMMAIRFQIYSISILIVFYLLLLTILKGKPRNFLIKIALSMSILICVYSYFKYNKIIKYYTNSLKADTYNFSNNNIFLHQYFNLPDPDQSFYKNYKFPTFFNEEIINDWKNKLQHTEIDRRYWLSVIRIANQNNLSHYLKPVIEFQVKTKEKVNSNIDYFLLINALDDNQTYLIAIRKNEKSWFKSFKPTSDTLTIVGDIPDKIPSGAYSISLGWLENDKINVKKLSSSTRL